MSVRAGRPGRLWWAIAAAAIAAAALAGVLAATPVGRGLAQRFLASLRIPTPKQVAVSTPGISGANSSRQLQAMVVEMLSSNVNVTHDEGDQLATNAHVAATLAGFPARLPALRTDLPTLLVTGAHTVTVQADRGQLNTIFTEAGRRNVSLPASLSQTPVTITTPRGVRAQFGSCPVPAANTLQGQVQGAPPLPADVRTCVVLTESPAVTATVPAGFDVNQLVEIALELSGMSPRQTEGFQRRLDWASTLAISIPRNVRSFDTVQVRGRPGMLFTGGGGRRGASYTLIWAANGMVYTLTGFGSPTEAVPLASSVN